MNKTATIIFANYAIIQVKMSNKVYWKFHWHQGTSCTIKFQYSKDLSNLKLIY